MTAQVRPERALKSGRKTRVLRSTSSWRLVHPDAVELATIGGAMEVTTVTTGVEVLLKLLAAGKGIWSAVKANGRDLEKDIDALKSVVEAWHAAGKANVAEPSLAARHLALVTSAFGAAWRDHWASNEGLAPRRVEKAWHDFLTAKQVVRDRREQARLALIHALSNPPQMGSAIEDIHLVEGISGDPLHSIFYKRLWRAFTDPALQDADPPPLLEVTGSAKRDFERQFRLACLEAFASSAGVQVRHYLDGLREHRAVRVRELTLAHMASWKTSHVFGTDSNAALPSMPLEHMYVEPLGECEKETGPILKAIRRTLEKHPVAVVIADFGHGKSLTARTLAVQLATDYLLSSAPSSELLYPVFIKCAEDLLRAQQDLEHTVRRAQKRLATAIGIASDLADSAFAPPGPDQRALFILDGLDEVALHEREFQEFVETLWEKSSLKHRFLIFSRPAAAQLPSSMPQERRPTTIKLLPFHLGDTGGQAAEWLERWNAAAASWTVGPGITKSSDPVTLQAIRHAGLYREASTPILLFMIAYSLTTQDGRKLDRARLYDVFFEQLARSKHEFDKDSHPAVAAASKTLLEELQRRGEAADTDEPLHAMIWLMARTAWRARQLESNDKALSQRHIDEIIQDELGIMNNPAVAKTIRVGLLLSLQADLEGSAPRILFGHRSFAEYMIARFWASRIRRIVSGPRKQAVACETALSGGRLLGADDQALHFLVAQLQRCERTERRAIVEWASDTFADETISPAAAVLRADERPLLREATLAIGSLLSADGIEVEPLALRSLLAWFWLTGRAAFVFAPRLRAKCAQLAGVPLSWADLRSADLSGAMLQEAQLYRANLSGACLVHANLTNAQLRGATMVGVDASHAILDFVNTLTDRGDESSLATADWSSINLTSASAEGARLQNLRLVNARFDHAKMPGVDLRRAQLNEASFVRAVCPRGLFSSSRLTGADLRHAQLRRADFDDANLENANLSDAALDDATFRKANLASATLVNARLVRAEMDGANLRRAILRNANLASAHLARCDLRNAELEGANLGTADLSGADLRGAVLRSAHLHGANLDGCLVDETTDASGTDMTTARNWRNPSE
jgi:uncharacterized protein YjbI with pentapeptide repeats